MIEAKIYQESVTGEINITFIDRKEGRLYVAQPVELILKERRRGERVEPTIRMDYLYAQEFLKALAEALDKNGIKIDKDAKMEGLLEATRYHLEDLRKLLKLNIEGGKEK